MQIEEIVNRKIFGEQKLLEFSNLFQNNKPIRHVVIDGFLSNQYAENFMRHFPSLENMNKHYHGINERKAETSDFGKMHEVIQKLPDYLSSIEFINWLQNLTGIESLVSIHDRLGYGLHQGGNNSFLDIHIDYNIHPVKKLQRKLNFILFFNPYWKKEWGGQLELWDNKVENCIQSIDPIFNRCVIFECSEVSYHGYNLMKVPENTTRKSYYQYFFIPTERGLVYHDTIFKSRPNDGTSKRLLTSMKEFTKNTVKRVLYYTGLERYLK